MDRIPPHPLNAPGDFYVEHQMCIACQAPEHEAPELISHDESNHCYFRRQPSTADELAHAIWAVAVGCCGAVRYGGRDPAVIARLTELHAREECDHA
jgi:hypothetical protein